MSRVAKPDWAERKARNLFLDTNGPVTIAIIAKLLRAERARAVRVCRGQRFTNPAIVGGGYDHNKAIDDCIKAIQRKP